MALAFSEIAKEVVNHTAANISVVQAFHSPYPNLEESFYTATEPSLQDKLDKMSRRTRDREGMVALQNLKTGFQNCVNKILDGVLNNWLFKWTEGPIEFLYDSIKVSQEKYPDLKLFNQEDKPAEIMECVNKQSEALKLPKGELLFETTCINKELQDLAKMLADYEAEFNQLLEAQREAGICIRQSKSKGGPDFQKLKPLLDEYTSGAACKTMNAKKPPACADKVCSQFKAEASLRKHKNALSDKFNTIQEVCIIEDSVLKSFMSGRDR